MEPLLVYPDPPSTWLSDALEHAAYPWRAAWPIPPSAERDEPEDGFAGAVDLGGRGSRRRLCRLPHSPQRRQPASAGAARVAGGRAWTSSSSVRTCSTTSCCRRATAREVEARLAHLFWRTGRGKQHDLIVYGPLALNLETYQAAIQGRPLDLTFMEYELLRFLAAHPGKVFTREALLSRVWGYEYFGGARGPSTSTSGACGPSSGRSTRT